MPVNKWNIKGGREKKAIKLAGQTPAKAHGNAPADLPGTPPPSPTPDPGEWQRWLDFSLIIKP